MNGKTEATKAAEAKAAAAEAAALGKAAEAAALGKAAAAEPKKSKEEETKAPKSHPGPRRPLPPVTKYEDLGAYGHIIATAMTAAWADALARHGRAWEEIKDLALRAKDKLRGPAAAAYEAAAKLRDRALSGLKAKMSGAPDTATKPSLRTIKEAEEIEIGEITPRPLGPDTPPPPAPRPPAPLDL